MLNVHRLRVLRAVVAAGSVSRAAETLGYTPSAVSQQLTALQRETGLTLFEPSGRGIEPTSAGRRLARESDDVLDRLTALEAVVADLRAGRIGSLALRYFLSVGSAWMPDVLATLTAEFPDLRLDLRLVEAGEDRTWQPDVDVVVDGTVPSLSASYEDHPLLVEPYVVVVPEDHRLAGWVAVPLRELAEEAWVENELTHGPCREIVLSACATVGFSPRWRLRTHDYASAMSFVRAGVGVTVLPRLGLGPSVPSGLTAIPLVDPVPQRRIVVRVRSTVRHSPAAARAVELLQQQAAMTPHQDLGADLVG